MTEEPENSSRRRVLSRAKSNDSMKRATSSRRLVPSSSGGVVIRKERSSRNLSFDDGASPREVEDYDDAIVKVAERFGAGNGGNGRSSGKERRPSRKLQRAEGVVAAAPEPSPPLAQRTVGHHSVGGKKTGMPESYEDALAKVAARFSAEKDSAQVSRRHSSRRSDMADYSKGDAAAFVNNYDDALAKVAARFSAETSRSSGKEKKGRWSVTASSTSREKAVPDNYEDALAKVAARFSSGRSNSLRSLMSDDGEKAKRRGSHKSSADDNNSHAMVEDKPKRRSSHKSLADDNDNHGTVEDKPKRRSSHKYLAEDNGTHGMVGDKPKRRSSHKYLAEDNDTHGMVEDKPKRRSSQKYLAEDNASQAVVVDKPKRRSSHKSSAENNKTATLDEDKPRRRTSSKLLDDEKEVVEEVKKEIQRRLSESSNNSVSKESVLDARSAPVGRGLSRQISDDSVDFDGAIVEAMNEEESNHGDKRGPIDEPKRKVERRGSDSSLDPNKPAKIGGPGRGRERSRGLRRTNSDDLHLMELAERAEADVRVRTDPSPKRKPERQKKSGLRVTFIQDMNEKAGIKSTYIENCEDPLTAEEKAAAWYGGRNYKLFKSLCYAEAVEAKENEDYCSRFDKVWSACATTSVDFAWQEIMKAEHKKSSPNNAVMLAKARCRGFEREIFPDTLLRNRLATVKYVVRSYKQALLSMTISKDEQDTAVREASLRCSQPFRRFARLMAEGDALLVSAWERVTKKEDNSNESRRSNAQMERRASRRDLMAANGRQSVRNLFGTEESRRDLFSSLKSSGSCRKLISSSDYSEESRRNLVASSKGSSNDRRDVMSKVESHRDLLMSLKSSGSSRKLMVGDFSHSNSKDRDRQESKRNLMSGSKSESRRSLMSGAKSESRRTESKRNLGSKSLSGRRLQMDHDLDEEEEATARPSRRGDRHRLEAQ